MLQQLAQAAPGRCVCPVLLRSGKLIASDSHCAHGTQLQLQIPLHSPLPLHSFCFPPQLKVDLPADPAPPKGTHQSRGRFAPALLHPGASESWSATTPPILPPRVPGMFPPHEGSNPANSAG